MNQKPKDSRAFMQCPRCHGTGGDALACLECSGRGAVPTPELLAAQGTTDPASSAPIPVGAAMIPCRRCDGSGTVPAELGKGPGTLGAMLEQGRIQGRSRCPDCQGTGRMLRYLAELATAPQPTLIHREAPAETAPSSVHLLEGLLACARWAECRLRYAATRAELELERIAIADGLRAGSPRDPERGETLAAAALAECFQANELGAATIAALRARMLISPGERTTASEFGKELRAAAYELVSMAQTFELRCSWATPADATDLAGEERAR